MNKNTVVKKISAYLCTAAMICTPSVSLAAYVQNSAVMLGVSAGLDLIRADASFTDGMEGWNISGGDADVSGGEIKITSSGKASLTTDIGGSLYESASGSDVISWDFETDDDIAGDVSLNAEDDLGKWTSARASTPYYTENQDMVEPYNYQYKAEGGKETVVINWQEGVSKLIPPEGSERCLTVFNPKNKEWTDYMGIRVKLSDSMLKAGETYTLSFWMMESSHRRAIYCGRTPYDDNELSVNTDSELKNGVLDYKDWTHNLVMDKTVKQWTKYSTTFIPTADEFNDDGYTTLWIITTGKYKPGTTTLSNRNNIYKYEKFYFDNISLERSSDDVKTTNYHFSAKVKGESGKNITAKVEIDGKENLFEVTKTFADTDEWESLAADFSVNSNIPYLSGSGKGSSFESDNPRVKLFISSDADFTADDIHIIENIEDGGIDKYAGKSILVAAQVMGFDNDDNVTAVCNIGDVNICEKPFSLIKGVNSFSLEGEIPTNAEGFLTFDIISGAESIFDRENNITMFYKGGANLYPSIDALKNFGEGHYLVEFDVADGGDKDEAVVSIGAVNEKADVFSNGIGIAEIYLTNENIKRLSQSDKITVSCGKAVSNITLKKVADAVK